VTQILKDEKVVGAKVPFGATFKDGTQSREGLFKNQTSVKRGEYILLVFFLFLPLLR